MRNAILQLPDHRTAGERRQVLRAAIRQLERAELYLAAVAYMELEGRETQRAVNKLRSDVDTLRRSLIDQRGDIRD
jgi:acyl-CoA reductase-like NAD-dependent aldehyde dehydrogenase